MTPSPGFDAGDYLAEADENSNSASLTGPGLRSTLEIFSQNQRLLAGVEHRLPGVLAAWADADLTGLTRRITSLVERSFNFDEIPIITKSILSTAVPVPNFAEQLSRAILLPSLVKTNVLIGRGPWELLAARTRDLATPSWPVFVPKQFVPDVTHLFRAPNWERVREGFKRFWPTNVSEIDEMDAVAAITLEEGLPLAWVPRHEIVVLLLSADSASDRELILLEHFDSVLDDCEDALVDIDHKWAELCHNAIQAARGAFLGPAQSHASNIIDSVILAILGDRGREVARRRAAQDYHELPLRVACENLVLRPLFRGLTSFRVGRGDPVPIDYSRHATAHAIGHPGVLSRRNALVAIMLATSLIVQYWDAPNALSDNAAELADGPSGSQLSPLNDDQAV